MHRNARLTPWGRQLLVRRVHAGRPAAHVAAEMGVSRATAYKWLRRFVGEGAEGFEDRSSRPTARHGGRRRAGGADLRASPGAQVRAGADRLRARDRAIDRSSRARPPRHLAPSVDGSPDRARDPPLRARAARRARARRHQETRPARPTVAAGARTAAQHDADNRHGPRVGYEYVHSAVDDHSRLAYSEILPDERGASCAGFLERAIRFYRDHDITVERVLTDNAIAYRHGIDFHRVLDEHGIGHRLIRPYRPQTNGKVERYNRTLLDEWAYASAFHIRRRAQSRAHNLARRVQLHHDHTTHSPANHPPAASTTSRGTTPSRPASPPPGAPPSSARCSCTNAIAMLPSPTPEATRLMLPWRTSPAAKMPGTLVSSRYGSRSSGQASGIRSVTSRPVQT